MIDCIEQATRMLDDLDPNAARLDEFEVNPLARKVLAPLDLQRKDWQTHMILADTLALYDLLPPLLEKAGCPATLYLAAQSYNTRLVDCLVYLLQQHPRLKVELMASNYFKRTQAPRVNYTEEVLPPDRVRLHYSELHAKVITAHFPASQYLTIETSANFRALHNLENLTITNSKQHHNHHLQWIQDQSQNPTR